MSSSTSPQQAALKLYKQSLLEAQKNPTIHEEIIKELKIILADRMGSLSNPVSPLRPRPQIPKTISINIGEGSAYTPTAFQQYRLVTHYNIVPDYKNQKLQLLGTIQAAYDLVEGKRVKITFFGLDVGSSRIMNWIRDMAPATFTDKIEGICGSMSKDQVPLKAFKLWSKIKSVLMEDATADEDFCLLSRLDNDEIVEALLGLAEKDGMLAEFVHNLAIIHIGVIKATFQHNVQHLLAIQDLPIPFVLLDEIDVTNNAQGIHPIWNAMLFRAEPLLLKGPLLSAWYGTLPMPSSEKVSIRMSSTRTTFK